MNLQFSDKVERWSLERLIPHARNARTHSDEQVAQIAGSIAEFGFVNPVLVGGDGVIVAGHGRVMAARKLGLSEAPVIVLAHLSPTQRRALMIADNQIATNAGWNEEMLAAELAALNDEAFDLDLLGFDDAEIDRLLADTLDPEETIDEVPEPPADPVSRPGDLWLCGEHRVLCGDATVLADVEKVLDGELADMAFTDPPYNVMVWTAPAPASSSFEVCKRVVVETHLLKERRPWVSLARIFLLSRLSGSIWRSMCFRSTRSIPKGG
jgi:hypothetical protein